MSLLHLFRILFVPQLRHDLARLLEEADLQQVELAPEGQRRPAFQGVTLERLEPDVGAVRGALIAVEEVPVLPDREPPVLPRNAAPRAHCRVLSFLIFHRRQLQHLRIFPLCQSGHGLTVAITAHLLLRLAAQPRDLRPVLHRESLLLGEAVFLREFEAPVEEAEGERGRFVRPQNPEDEVAEPDHRADLEEVLLGLGFQLHVGPAAVAAAFVQRWEIGVEPLPAKAVELAVVPPDALLVHEHLVPDQLLAVLELLPRADRDRFLRGKHVVQLPAVLEQLFDAEKGVVQDQVIPIGLLRDLAAFLAAIELRVLSCGENGGLPEESNFSSNSSL